MHQNDKLDILIGKVKDIINNLEEFKDYPIVIIASDPECKDIAYAQNAGLELAHDMIACIHNLIHNALKIKDNAKLN